MKIVALDQANKQCQFDITESASGISFKFEGNAQGLPDNLNFRFQKISKDEENLTLFEGNTTELRSVLDQLIDFDGIFFPFANRKNLVLTNDTKIRITIDWKTAQNGEGVQSISYDLTTEFADTVKPLVILKEDFSLTEDINTVNYDYVLLPLGFTSIETVATVLEGEVQKQKKQYLTENAFQSLNIGTKGDRLLKTFTGQKVKLTMPDDAQKTYYLIQY
jgi:hypothetical protein